MGWTFFKGRRAGVVPSVSGMGMGAADTAAGLVALRLRKTALDKRLAAELALWYHQPSGCWAQTRAPAS